MQLFSNLIHFSFPDVQETAFLQAGEEGDLLFQLTDPYFTMVLHWRPQFLVRRNEEELCTKPNYLPRRGIRI